MCAITKVPSWAGELVRMKKRVQSSRLFKPWGFFILAGFSDNWDKLWGQACGSHPHPSGFSFYEKSPVGERKYFPIRIAGVFLSSIIAFSIVASWPVAQVHSEDIDPMKRRRQGILTGMPFMSNLAPRTFVDDTYKWDHVTGPLRD